MSYVSNVSISQSLYSEGIPREQMISIRGENQSFASGPAGGRRSQHASYPRQWAGTLDHFQGKELLGGR